jgi:hypothetical protein
MKIMGIVRKINYGYGQKFKNKCTKWKWRWRRNKVWMQMLNKVILPNISI